MQGICNQLKSVDPNLKKYTVIHLWIMDNMEDWLECSVMANSNMYNEARLFCTVSKSCSFSCSAYWFSLFSITWKYSSNEYNNIYSIYTSMNRKKDYKGNKKYLFTIDRKYKREIRRILADKIST